MLVAAGEEKEKERAQVVQFLQEAKQAITRPFGGFRGWEIVPRPENKDCILQLGFRYSDVREVLLGLSVEDYCEGPLEDKDMPGDLWVFGKAVDGREVYIKLKLAKFGSITRLRVVSFHFPRACILYPLKETE